MRNKYQKAMIARQDERFYVSDIKIKENVAVVTCKPGINVQKYIQIGQSITTADFNLAFKGCKSKWKIIFYPNGQYDFGIPSNDQRFYFMLASCEKATVKLKIQASVNMKLSQSYNVKTVSSEESESVFISDDKLRNWAGPLAVNASANKSSEIESVKCTFRLISNEMNERKRDSREANFQLAENLLTNTLKKSRSMSSSAAKDQNILTEGHSPMEVDDPIESSPGPSTSRSNFSMEIDVKTSPNPLLTKSTSPEVVDISLEKPLPNPFTKKSPVLYNRLTLPSFNRNTVAERKVSLQRGDFKFKKPSPRTIIFSPEEREKARSSCRKMSLSRSDDVSSENVQSSQFKSSGCLKQSDVVRIIEPDPDKQSTQSGSGEKCETSASEENTLLTSDDDDDDCIDETRLQVRKKLRYFDNKFKK